MRRLLPFAALAALALPASAQDAAPPARDGIHVVGAWTLTVTDPDGSVVERREFHNDYVGGAVLPQILSGFLTQGRWQVIFDGAPSLCADSSGSESGCVIREPDPDDLEGPQFFDNLVVSSVSEDGAAVLRLLGSAAVTSAGSIMSVRTRHGVCDGDTAPESCGASASVGSSPFTYRELTADALAVEAGQTVNVQVDISFE